MVVTTFLVFKCVLLLKATKMLIIITHKLISFNQMELHTVKLAKLYLILSKNCFCKRVIVQNKSKVITEHCLVKHTNLTIISN